MRYVVTAIRGDERRTLAADSAHGALDGIDAFVADLFRIEKVEDENGAEVSTVVLMNAYMAENGIKRPER